MFGVFGQTTWRSSAARTQVQEDDRTPWMVLQFWYTCIWSVMTVIFLFTYWKNSWIYSSQEAIRNGGPQCRQLLNLIRSLFRNGCDQCLRNAMQGLWRNGDLWFPVRWRWSGKVVDRGDSGATSIYRRIVAEPIVRVIMVILLIVKILKMPEFKENSL